MSATAAPRPGAGPRAVPLRLGEYLVAQGILAEDQVRVALTEQKLLKMPLGKVLVSLGLVSESIVRDALAELNGTQSIDLSALVPDAEALALVSKEVARKYHMIPVSFDRERGALQLAMSKTHDVVALDQTSALLGEGITVHPVLAGEAEIEQAINQFYGFDYSLDGILAELENAGAAELSLGQRQTYSHPLVRLVDAMLADAVKQDASDIHFEPEPGFLRVRFRVDGVLRQAKTLHKTLWAGISVRLKVMSGMDITETRAPQDGRMSLTLLGREVDFRIATQPTTDGENIVLRVLDRRTGIIPFADLPLTARARRSLEIMMARPEGIILVTGPTGSGKTTTLYSMLMERNDEAVNIMTLEDPVEYPMPMIRQSSVNESVKMDFVNGIRSMMRQDPDIILVGEIRDRDTADMAFRAAMTGHQVFSTLHTNSALGAIPRLLDIGIAPQLLSGNVIGIIGQRLVRKLCQACCSRAPATEVEIALLGETSDELQLHHPEGCERCSGTGYKGRLALIEVLKFSLELDDLIAAGAAMPEIQRKALEEGFKTLADDGLRLVRDGITSLDEVVRVVDLTRRVV